MLELEGGRIGQPCEKLSPLHLTTLLVPSIDVKTLFLGSSRLAAHGGGRLASQIVLLHEIFCFWCHALVTRDKAVNAPPTPLPWCSPARFIPPLGEGGNSKNKRTSFLLLAISVKEATSRGAVSRGGQTRIKCLLESTNLHIFVN